MCKCAEQAIKRGFIVRGSIFSEATQDFEDTDFYMPLVVPGKKDTILQVHMVVNKCPICGEDLPL